MSNGGEYPFNDRDKLFAQNGFMQAEIAELKKNQITEADLLKMEARLDRAAVEREEKRTAQLQADLDAAFKRGIPGTQQLVATEVQRIQEQDQEQFEQNLKRAGLEFKDDGSIGPKIHPVRRTIVRNTNIVLFGLGVAAAANPDQAINLVRLGFQFAF